MEARSGLRIGNDTFSFRYPALEALAELERAADEKIRADESIPPPVAPSPPSDLASGTAKGGGPDAALRDEPRQLSAIGGAPIAEMPQRRGSDSRKKGGWNSTDFMVVLLALGVLTLSAVGLYWLLRG